MINLAEKVKMNSAITLTKKISPQMGYYKAAYEKAGEMYINIFNHMRQIWEEIPW